MQRKANFYVYILECKNKTLYTGYTKNLEKRIKLHNSDYGAKYLRGKTPVELVYYKAYKYFKSALNAEREIKKLRKYQKEELINAYRRQK